MKRVLITGATSGIGLRLVSEYIENGYHVIAAGRNQDKLDELKQQHDNLQTLAFDVTKLDEIKQAAASLEALDHLVLNAGNCEYMKDLPAFDSALFERVIKVNLLSVGYCLEALLPKLKAGSQLGIVGSSVTYLAFTEAQAYGASKSGIDYLAKSLSVDLARSDIGVSLIQPGFVETPLTDKNTFEMPGKVSAEFAAKKIYAGMAAKKHIIRFPTFFILMLRFFSSLPFALWRKIAMSMVNK